MKTSTLNKRAKLIKLVIVTSIIAVALLVILFFVLMYNHLSHPVAINSIEPNLYLGFDDRSEDKENPSIIVFLDNNEIIRLDSISHFKNKTVQLKLDSGLHSIKVKTLDGGLNLSDLFRINNPEISYRLCIMYYNDSLYKRFEILFHDLLRE